MKSINEKYARLQQTSWPQYANTTLGHLPAEMFKKIESAYDEQLALEMPPVQSVPTPDIEMPVAGETVQADGDKGQF